MPEVINLYKKRLILAHSSTAPSQGWMGDRMTLDFQEGSTSWQMHEYEQICSCLKPSDGGEEEETCNPLKWCDLNGPPSKSHFLKVLLPSRPMAPLPTLTHGLCRGTQDLKCSKYLSKNRNMGWDPILDCIIPSLSDLSVARHPSRRKKHSLTPLCLCFTSPEQQCSNTQCSNTPVSRQKCRMILRHVLI